jgi:hypothetical protein
VRGAGGEAAVGHRPAVVSMSGARFSAHRHKTQKTTEHKKQCGCPALPHIERHAAFQQLGCQLVVTYQYRPQRPTTRQQASRVPLTRLAYSLTQ